MFAIFSLTVSLMKLVQEKCCTYLHWYQYFEMKQDILCYKNWCFMCIFMDSS